MLGCSHSKPMREKLLAMVNGTYIDPEAAARYPGYRQVGGWMSDAAILDAFVKEYGVQILVRPPARGFNLLGYVMPFIGIALGLVFVWWAIKRFRKPLAVAAGPELDDATFAAYQAQIEKDLEKLDR